MTADTGSPPRLRGLRALLLLGLALPACAPVRPALAHPTCPFLSRELVDVRRVDPSFAVDLRYTTPDNFTGAVLPGYDAPRALLRPAAAQALARVQAGLRAQGLGLRIFDAYRPVRATLAMVEWAERTGNQWVLEQGYVARESGHNLGGTVDLTLVGAEGTALDMGTAFDDFSPAAHTENATGEVLENRRRLVQAMEAEGWRNYPQEWWHFRYAGDYAPLDLPLSCFLEP